jgi:hypothetical protein
MSGSDSTLRFLVSIDRKNQFSYYFVELEPRVQSGQWFVNQFDMILGP